MTTCPACFKRAVDYGELIDFLNAWDSKNLYEPDEEYDAEKEWFFDHYNYSEY